MPEGRATRIVGVVVIFVVGFWLVGHARRNWLPGPTLDPTVWVGVEVMPKRHAKLRNALGAVDDLDLPVPYTVQSVRGDRLEVGDFDRRWIRGVDVVRLDEAFDYYAELLDEGEHSGWALNMRGILWRRRGEEEKAIADYDRALIVDPNHQPVNTYYNRGRAWHDKGEFDKAIEDFDAALRRNPNFAIGFLSRGKAWAAKGEYVKALADLDRAVELEPRDPYGFNVRSAVRASAEKAGK